MLEQLHKALGRRDVFASPSNRWADPRARLLDGAQWEAVQADVLHGLSLEEPVAEHLAGRVRALRRGAGGVQSTANGAIPAYEGMDRRRVSGEDIFPTIRTKPDVGTPPRRQGGPLRSLHDGAVFLRRLLGGEQDPAGETRGRCTVPGNPATAPRSPPVRVRP